MGLSQSYIYIQNFFCKWDLINHIHIYSKFKCVATQRNNKTYILVHDIWFHLLICAALNPNEAIGSKQARNFVLCKKEGTTPKPMTIKESHGWKGWINKSLSFKILSH